MEREQERLKWCDKSCFLFYFNVTFSGVLDISCDEEGLRRRLHGMEELFNTDTDANDHASSGWSGEGVDAGWIVVVPTWQLFESVERESAF